jgi:hypothetical protein
MGRASLEDPNCPPLESGYRSELAALSRKLVEAFARRLQFAVRHQRPQFSRRVTSVPDGSKIKPLSHTS